MSRGSKSVNLRFTRFFRNFLAFCTIPHSKIFSLSFKNIYPSCAFDSNSLSLQGPGQNSIFKSKRNNHFACFGNPIKKGGALKSEKNWEKSLLAKLNLFFPRQQRFHSGSDWATIEYDKYPSMQCTRVQET